jgi:hypothetical protein
MASPLGGIRPPPAGKPEGKNEARHLALHYDWPARVPLARAFLSEEEPGLAASLLFGERAKRQLASRLATSNIEG